MDEDSDYSSEDEKKKKNKNKSENLIHHTVYKDLQNMGICTQSGFNFIIEDYQDDEETILKKKPKQRSKREVKDTKEDEKDK